MQHIDRIYAGAFNNDWQTTAGSAAARYKELRL